MNEITVVPRPILAAGVLLVPFPSVSSMFSGEIRKYKLSYAGPLQHTSLLVQLFVQSTKVLPLWLSKEFSVGHTALQAVFKLPVVDTERSCVFERVKLCFRTRRQFVRSITQSFLYDFFII
jgi:hypothetical protein